MGSRVVDNNSFVRHTGGEAETLVNLLTCPMVSTRQKGFDHFQLFDRAPFLMQAASNLRSRVSDLHSPIRRFCHEFMESSKFSGLQERSVILAETPDQNLIRWNNVFEDWLSRSLSKTLASDWQNRTHMRYQEHLATTASRKGSNEVTFSI